MTKIHPAGKCLKRLLHASVAILAGAGGAAAEPAILSTLEDGNEAIVLADPAFALPNPAQLPLLFDPGARPHGLAFLGLDEGLFADFSQPRLYRMPLVAATSVSLVGMVHRSNGNGTLAVSPSGRYAISIGQSASGSGEAVVLDFSHDPPLETPIPGDLRVLPFVTAAIEFDRQGRAFVCHVDGVSVLSPPYTAIDFSMAFPPTLQSPSMCRLSRDGQRLFVTRLLSEGGPSVNGVRTTQAPFSATSEFIVMPAPADVQGLGPMAVSPDGKALIVGQQFLFPPAFQGTRARAFLLRAPFDGDTRYAAIELPPSVVGLQCTDAGAPFDCAGFEHIEVSWDGDLAILTGNSSRTAAATADAVPAVFLLHPFDDALRTAHAVEVGALVPDSGRGAGGVRFQPIGLFGDGFEG